MPRLFPRIVMTTALLPALMLGGCMWGRSADGAQGSEAQDIGPRPTLPAPHHRLIPTVNIAPARRWPAGAMPTPAAGFQVTALATGLQHPRSIYVLPNGDVLVAETNAPAQPAQTGIRAWIMGKVMEKAGATAPSANRITLLRDADGDGVAETRSVFLQGLSSPFGMALVGETFYVANADAVVKFPYRDGETSIAAAAVKVADLPGGPINHHWTKSLLASRDGSRLYVGVGSNSNVGENGMAAEQNRAAIVEIDPATGALRVFASGLRNPTALAWQPQTGALWAVVNERDELGDQLVPDYLTAVREDAFYGWPYSYYGQHVDKRIQPPRPDLVATAIAPDYALGSHVAPLGLAFASCPQSLPRRNDCNGAFVGLHGSWNRSRLSGYKLVFVPFAKGMPDGDMRDVLTGFVDAEGNARGRPVGVAVDASGAVLVVDDVGNTVWRVARVAVPGP